MEFHKKILLLLTIIIASVIIYRLWCNRQKIQNTPIEGYMSLNMNTKCANYDLSLNQYFIKASWNSAYTGTGISNKYATNTMDASMVTDVLTRGCRFLDFEIYAVQIKENDKDYTPVVGFSYTYGNRLFMDSSDPPLPFDTVLKTIKAFNANEDPIFIQLRIQSEQKDMFTKIKSMIKDKIKDDSTWKLDRTKTPLPTSVQQCNDNKLSAFKQKYIFMFDGTNSAKECSEGFLNMEPPFSFTLSDNNNFLGKNIYNKPYTEILGEPTREISIKDTSGNTVKYTSIGNYKPPTVAFPPFIYLNGSNPTPQDLQKLIIKYGVNIIPYRFYIDDYNLEIYEKLFPSCPFVPMASLINHYKNTPIIPTACDKTPIPIPTATPTPTKVGGK